MNAVNRRRAFTVAAAVLALDAAASAGNVARAQYIARKLSLTGWPQSAVGVSGNRAVGTFGSLNVRLREDAMRWDIRTGTPIFPENGVNSAYSAISGDWVIRSEFDFSLIQTTSNRSFSAKNVVTGQTFDLGTSASAANSQGYTSVAPNLRENWAFTNTDQRAVFLVPYNIYSSAAVNLSTGQTYGFSWSTGPFSYYPRRIIDISGGRALVDYTASGYGFLDLPTGNITEINTGLTQVVGMSGDHIAGRDATTFQAALYDTATQTKRALAGVAGLASLSVADIGAKQTVGVGYTGGNQGGRALLWDNATGGVTDLHAFLPAGYFTSAATAIDRAYADGPVLLTADAAAGSDQFVLRRLDANGGTGGGGAGTFTEIGADEIATFTDDFVQTGGAIVNNGAVRWTNPSGSWTLSGGLLTGTGPFGGGIANGGGILSGGGGGGTGGSVGAFSATGGYTQGANGTLLVSLGGPSSFDTFSFGGPATLGGTLRIELLDGFVPDVGQSFAFFTASGITGAWADVTAPDRGRWAVDYTPTSASLTYLGASAPEPSALALLLGATAPVIAAAYRRRCG